MFFKNLRVYRFNKAVPWTADELQDALNEKPFTPCQGAEPHRLGWTAPAPAIDGEALTYELGNCVLLALKRQEKILPASVVREALEERIAQIELQEQRKVGKKEKTDLKDQITTDLLPRAFTRSRMTFGYIDRDKGLLWVDTASNARADEFTATLRETAGSLPVQFVELKESPVVHFTAWIAENNCPNGFVFGDQCELRTSDDEGKDTVIRCKGSQSLAEVIGTHIESGLTVTELALGWEDRLTFTVNESLHIKRLKPTDQLAESREFQGDDAAERFSGSFSLLTLELRQLYDALLEALGGEDLGPSQGQAA